MQTFKSPNGKDFSLQEICELADDSQYDYEIFVGTDSQVHRKKRKVLYVTCVVLHKKGKGGRYFIHKEWGMVPDKVKKGTKEAWMFLRQRLTNEVWRSVQTCFNLQEFLPQNAEIIVDVDLNQDPKYKSGEYVQELVGMVTGQGFRCRAKPNSWAAMSVADRHSK